MAQYRKDVFNLARGPGQAIADPREDEARAREASARADRALAQQTLAQAQQDMLAQQELGIRAAAQAYEQQFAQQNFDANQAQFEREMQFRAGQSDLQAALQREGMAGQQQEGAAQRALQQYLAEQGFGLQREGMAAEESRFGRGLASQQYEGLMGRALQREGMAQSGRQFDTQQAAEASRFDRSFGLQGQQFQHQQAQDAFQAAMQSAGLGMQARQFDMESKARQDAKQQQGYEWLAQNAPDVLKGKASALTRDQILMLKQQPGNVSEGVRMVLENPATMELAERYYQHGAQGLLRPVSTSDPFDYMRRLGPGALPLDFLNNAASAFGWGPDTQDQKTVSNMLRLSRRAHDLPAASPLEQNPIDMGVLQALAAQLSTVRPLPQGPSPAPPNPYNYGVPSVQNAFFVKPVK